MDTDLVGLRRMPNAGAETVDRFTYNSGGPFQLGFDGFSARGFDVDQPKNIRVSFVPSFNNSNVLNQEVLAAEARCCQTLRPAAKQSLIQSTHERSRWVQASARNKTFSV